MPRPKSHMYSIPLHGNYTANDFTQKANSGGNVGKCEVCNEKVGRLREHFSKYHGTPDTRFKSRFVTLVDSITIPAKLVHPGNGFCGLCDSDNGEPVPFQHLKSHYVEDHLEGKWVCPVCYNRYHPKYQLAHLRTHSGQVKCLVQDCTSQPETYQAALVHLFRNHPDILPEDRHKYVEDLTDEEYRVAEIKKAIASGQWDRRREKRYIGIVRELGPKLETYNGKRLRGDPTLINKINLLYKKFLQYFDVPSDEDIILVKNSSFISLWSVRWMCPVLVFEKVPKTTGLTQLQANTFHPDPQVCKLNQPKNDSLFHSGFARGHMAAGADFRVEEDFIQSHLYTNICAQRRYLNWIVRPKMEHYIRQRANSQDEPVFAVHFPIMNGFPTTQNGIRIADSFGCVLLSEERRGLTGIGWELANNDKKQDFRNNVIDPFTLLGKTTVPFRKLRGEFLTIHTTTPPLPLTPPSSSATSSAGTTSSSTSTSASATFPPSISMTSFHSLDADGLDEDKEDGNEKGKSHLTQLVINMQMEVDKQSNVGGNDNCRKRSPPSSTSPSPLVKRKRKVEKAPTMPLPVASGSSCAVTHSQSSRVELDPEAEFFRMPKKQTHIDNFFKVFRARNPPQKQQPK